MRPVLDPGDILGVAREAEKLVRARVGESFNTMNFNESLALLDHEARRVCRRRAALKVMSLIRKRPTYRPIPVSRSSPHRVRIRAPRRSRHSVAVASRGGGDDGGGGGALVHQGRLEERGDRMVRGEACPTRHPGLLV